MKKIVLIGVFVLFLVSVFGIQAHAETVKPETSELTSILEWPSDGMLLTGEFEPSAFGRVTNNENGQTVIPVDDDGNYQSRNDSFLVPSILDGIDEVRIDDEGDALIVLTEDLTFIHEATITFGDYDGDEGYKGAGIHVRGSGSNQLRVRILRDLGGSGTSDLFVEHVDDGAGKEVKLVPLTVTAEPGDTIELVVLSKPESISVWVNGDLVLDDETAPKLSARMGLYYANNEADFENYDVFIADPIIEYGEGIISWSMPDENENVLSDGAEIAQNGNVWSSPGDVTYANNVITNTDTGFQDSFMLLNRYTTYPDLEVEDEVVPNGEVPFYIRASLEVDSYRDGEQWYSMGVTFKTDNAGQISVLLRRNGNVYVVNHDTGNERYILYQTAKGFSSLESGDILDLEIISTATTVSIYVNGVEEVRNLDISDYYDATGATVLGETGVEDMRHTIGAWYAYVSGTVTIEEAHYLVPVAHVDFDGDDEDKETYPEREEFPNNYESIDPPTPEEESSNVLVTLGIVLLSLTNVALIAVLVLYFKRRK